VGLKKLKEEKIDRYKRRARLGPLKLIKFLAICVALSMSWANMSLAASFDCNKARTQTEITICNDTELSALDALMGAWWKTDRKPIGDKEDPTVASQRDWLKRRDTCGSDLICILVHYKSRIEEFGFGTVGILDHSKGKPEYFLYSNLMYAYQASGFLYRLPNAGSTGILLKLKSPIIVIPSLDFLGKISSCNITSIKTDVSLEEMTFEDVLGADLWNDGEIIEEVATYTKWAGHGDQSTSVRYRLINRKFIPYKIFFDSCFDNHINQIEVIFNQK